MKKNLINENFIPIDEYNKIKSLESNFIPLIKESSISKDVKISVNSKITGNLKSEIYNLKYKTNIFKIIWNRFKNKKESK